MQTSKAVQQFPELQGYLRGELTEAVAKARLAPRIPRGHSIFDGHDPFEAPNFGRNKGSMPKNLDLVVRDDDTGNVVAIYEVKSTTADKSEFNVNGQCGVFMEQAQSQGIPTYLIVVRMGRAIAPDTLRKGKDSEPELDEDVFNYELAYFISTARVELYPSDAFEMVDRKFSITAAPTLI